MNSRERFLTACGGNLPDRVPVWAMRQAGRILPEYRALRERFSFLELVRTPELAAEVTLQPLKRFSEIDAAITFSDILVVPEALGYGYDFSDSGGIRMRALIERTEQIRELPPADCVRERLAYIAKAQKIVGRELAGTHALLGFAGSPWTLALYMVQGGHSGNGEKLLDLARRVPGDFEKLMTKISDAVAENLLMQIEDGAVDAVQIFDSWAAFARGNYEFLSAKWTARVIEKLQKRVPVIVFAKGLDDYKILAETGADVLSVDCSRKLSEVKKSLFPRKIVLQGNLDPAVLTESDLDIVRSRTQAVLDDMHAAGTAGFVFNLGHGVPAGANLDAFAKMLETVAAGGNARK